MTDSALPAKSSSIRVVRCPACDREVEWRPENRYRPFCSARCKGIDLGAWASEQYRVPGAPVPTAPDQED